ncbi:unnamed protein product [Cylicocyclus nassatus]|uniref:Phosphodiesterase n=1 Tax=Cylicocyclus nassatus TaxID=53992 RepID=A0AA36GPC8_CYLNA|nr:unnamed protein product [Cylicocyclus nassatus]
MRWCCGPAGPATPLLEAPAEALNDAFGPMSIRPHNTALVISESEPEGAFLDRLRALGWSINVSPVSQAVCSVQQLRPILLLLDNRIPELPTLSRNLHQHTTEDVFFVVIADRPIGEKRRKALAQAEIIHAVQWSSRDTSLVEFVARLANRIRVMPALFAVLDEADQAVEVCDESKVVQYVNRAYEAVTGCLRGEVVGQPESDLRRKSLPKPRDDGMMERRRSSSDWKCIRVPTSSHNNQYVYMKRRSTDTTMYRDVSLKSVRSQAGLVEAPISEVLSLLRDAAARVEGDAAQLVKEAVKVLSAHELYAPSITRFRDNDRIATQYYDGLIRLHHPSRQRKRSVVDAYREKRGSHEQQRRRVSADVKNALENDSDYTFDILQLEKITENHALTNLGVKIFERWKVADALSCNEDILHRWLCTIEAHYHAGNAYHNATHAADVLQATSYFLDSPAVAAHISEHHAVAAILAATVHDLDHPGRGNAFLINTRQSLAVLYNDHSVLENHHVALAFQLTLQQNNNVNIFSNLSREEFTSMRHAMVEMVLATDISRHFEYLVKFNKMNVVDVPDDAREGNSMTICNMLVKCADISNPTREWSLCQKWAYRIVEEYFDQTKEEREKGLPVTMEVFDRKTCNVPLTQCGFIDMFVREAFVNFAEFANLGHLSTQLEANYDQWKSQSSSWTPSNNLALHI